MSESLEALRSANPRADGRFAARVEASARGVRARLAAAESAATHRVARRGHPGPFYRRRGRVRLAAIGTAFVTAAAVTAVLTVGSPGGRPGVEDAAAAVERAATVTAAAADRSGTAVVRITHDDELWGGKTIRWHDGDLAISREEAPTPRPGSKTLVVDGILYGLDARGRWINEGDESHLDPDSGTTPAEHLAAVREDVGGVTLQRITDGMTAVTTSDANGGATTYSGTVAAGLIARETGIKEGRTIRVLPFGYVAHGAAADPTAALDAAVTVGQDGIVREITVAWGSGASAWTYTVSYRRLGSTAPILAPANALSLERMRSDALRARNAQGS